VTTTITPVAQYTASNPSVTSGAEGGLAFDTGPGPMNAALQMAFDRALYARGATWGVLEWTGEFAVYTASSNTTFAIRVGVIQAATLRDGNGVWRPYFTSATTILGLSNVESSPANLANSTWYYVYAWSDSAAPSSIKFQISTSPPTENAAPTTVTGYKRGETANYRYIASFATDASGVPILVTAHYGTYTYRISALPTATLRVLNAGTATTYAAVSLAALMPPHGSIAALSLDLVSTTNVSANFGNIQTYGDSGTGAFYLYVPATNGATAYRSIDIQADTSQRIQYLVTALNSAPTMSIYVRGWVE
jgi:hypothetical protein